VGGSFLGLILGGVLARSSAAGVPGLGSVRPVRHGLGLRQAARQRIRIPAKVDWLGNVLFAVGLIAVLTGIVYSLLPYGGHPTGWTNPYVLTAIFGGIVVLVLFGWVETKCPRRCSG